MGFHYEIQTQQKSRKIRDTLAKRIASLAKNGNAFSTDDAMGLSSYGRLLSKFENGLRHYFGWKGLHKAMTKPELAQPVVLNIPGKKPKNMSGGKSMEFFIRQMRSHIADEFLKAVDNCDGDRIIEIAAAVSFFKDKRPGNFVRADPERWKILCAKSSAESSREGWTVRQVAEYISGRNDLETPADGFAALRRKCVQLGFPLKSGQTNKKNLRPKSLKGNAPNAGKTKAVGRIS